VNLLDLTNAYASFPAAGRSAEPVFITRIVKPDGETIDWPGSVPSQAITPAEAYLMTSMLRDVIEEGTGRKAQVLGRPMAGKTGTANQHRDGWFVGYAPALSAGVWVGFDDHSPLGTSWAQGAGTALPIWIRFMEQALAGTPKEDFPVPPGVVFARIDPVNGLLAPPGVSDALFEAFLEGTEPRASSSRQGDRADPANDQPSTATPTADGRLPEGLFH
jgi:penicillin-binding protein 1A